MPVQLKGNVSKHILVDVTSKTSVLVGADARVELRESTSLLGSAVMFPLCRTPRHMSPGTLQKTGPS